MRYAIFGDIHGNLEAFEKVLEDIKKEKADKLYCVGDIVGYAAKPLECLNLIRSLNCKVVAGNHDYGAVDLADLTYFNDLAKKAIIWTRKKLDSENIEYLKGLPLIAKEGELTFVHSSLSMPDTFKYIFRVSDAKMCFDAMQTKFCFVGHSHVPLAFFDYNNKIDYNTLSKYGVIGISDFPREAKIIINVGSVGQPRDGNPDACYCIYDDEDKTIEYRRVKYNVKKTQQEIQKAGLPMSLAKRLEVGM